MENKRSKMLTISIVVGAILLYFLATDMVKILDPLLFPPIGKIVSAFIDSIPKLLESLISSLKLLVPGFGLALLAGITLGVIIGTNRTLNEAFKPIIFALNPIPSSMLTPYLIAIMPTFYLSSMAVIFIGCFWPILNSTINGIMLIDQKYLDYSKMIELDGFKRLLNLILPASAPSILSGIRTSLNLSFILLPIAEMFATNSGLGYFIQYYADFSDYARVLSGLIFMATFIVLVMYGFERIRKKILFWTINENN